MLQVLTPPSAALVNLDDAKVHLGVTGTDSDAIITSLIAAASAAVTSHIGRPIGQGEYRETLRFDHMERALPLSRWPVTSVTSIAEGDETLVASDFEVSTDDGLIHRLTDKGRYMCWPADVVVVEYEAGYAEIPADVQAAVLSVLSDTWGARSRDAAMKAISIGSIQLQYFDAAARNSLAAVAHLLEPYRIPMVG